MLLWYVWQMYVVIIVHHCSTDIVPMNSHILTLETCMSSAPISTLAHALAVLAINVQLLMLVLNIVERTEC